MWELPLPLQTAAAATIAAAFVTSLIATVTGFVAHVGVEKRGAARAAAATWAD